MKKSVILMSILALMFSLTSCIYTEKDLQEARQEAYDIGYSKGHSFGYAKGYNDCSYGKSANVYSEIDEENITDEMVYSIVDDNEKIYHTLDCNLLKGNGFFHFANSNEAQKAGFSPCETCL